MAKKKGDAKVLIDYPFTIDNIDDKQHDSIYIGIDPSTKIIGWSILDDKGNLLFMESAHIHNISKDNEENMMEKLFNIENVFIKHVEDILSRIKYNNKSFSIEHFSYYYRATKQKTIVALSTINYFLQYIITKKFDQPVETIYAVSARKIVGIVVDKKLKEDAKEKVFEYVSSRYEMSTDMTKTKRKNDGVYDACDSVIVSLSMVLSL